jgi:predicted N-acetyltransferase YhbS
MQKGCGNWVIDYFHVIPQDVATFLLNRKLKTISILNAYKMYDDLEKKLRAFDCGNHRANIYLRDEALEESVRCEENGATTLVLDDQEQVVAFFTTLPSEIEFDTGDFRKCLQISWIAVDTNFASQRIGEHLIKYILHIAKQVGFRFVTLDSFPSKVTWYGKLGFLCFEEKDEEFYFGRSFTKLEESESQLIPPSQRKDLIPVKHINDYRNGDIDANSLVYMYFDLLEQDSKEYYGSLSS